MSTPAPLFPLFLDLNGKAVLVVGGGTVAKRKVQALLESGANVWIGAPELEPSLQQWHSEQKLHYLQGEFDPAWLDANQQDSAIPDGVWLVIAATDKPEINLAVAQAAHARRIWANVVDDVALTNLHMPARIQRGPLQIAISSGGAAPMLARHIREKLETQFDDAYGDLATLFQTERERIRKAYPDLTRRRAFFDRSLRGEALHRLRAGDKLGAQAALQNAMRQGDAATRGRVALVGAGPGDPGLLTLRALRLLNLADVILCDQLVSAEVLALARRDADVIFVGKTGGAHCTPQSEIHQQMLSQVQQGKFVVRLKGGDPFVFGRGGEELEFLNRHAIAFEVVPGITAAIACSAYSGIPLTHREYAQSVRLVTAHCQQSLDSLDWPALAQERQTLAVYMGVSGLAFLQQQLLRHGRAANTPFAIIENGSRANQRVVIGQLGELAEVGIRASVRAPSLLIIGEVAQLGAKLHWFNAPPQVVRIKETDAALAAKAGLSAPQNINLSFGLALEIA